MKQFFFTLMALTGFGLSAACQPKMEGNASIDFELSRAGDKSHYYYNEVHESYQGWRFGLAQANLSARLRWGKSWSASSRLMLERRDGGPPGRLRLPLLQLQWAPAGSPFSLSLGRFINPFGDFNRQQLSIQRNFIALPLAYGYYTNISEKIGFLPGMGEDIKIRDGGAVIWGSSLLYYGGYASGLKAKWAIRPQRAEWELALTNRASNRPGCLQGPFRPGLSTRLALRPAYFWRQGFSLAYGPFMESTGRAAPPLPVNRYYQWLLGTDYQLGWGYFEVSGELIAAFYKAPRFLAEADTFAASPQYLNGLSSYVDIKYSFPFLGGAYAAYRLEGLWFGKYDTGRPARWDHDVVRHTLGLGYRINTYLLARASLSGQQVDNKPWSRRQRSFRLQLTAHY